MQKWNPSVEGTTTAPVQRVQFDLREIGFTLAMSPETERELEALKQERARTAIRSRNLIFD